MTLRQWGHIGRGLGMPYAGRIPFHWIIPLVVPLVVTDASAAKGIDGPPEAVRFLRNVQEKNLSDYRSGWLRAKAHWVLTSVDKKSIVVDAEGEFFWNGEDAIWDLQVDEDNTAYLPENVPAEKGMHSGHRRMLSLSDRSYVYQVGADGRPPSLREHVKPRERGLPRDYWWYPERLWFKFGFSTRSWHDFLDEKVFDAGFDRVLTKVNETTYELKHTHVGSGDSLLFLFDLSKGGNLTAYEQFGAIRSRGTYEWVQARSGHWYAKHVERIEHNTRLGDIPQGCFIIDISEFDVSAELPKEMFKPDSLKGAIDSSHLRTGTKGVENR